MKHIITIVQNYTRKISHACVPLAVLLMPCTCNTTDSNQLIITLHNGNTYIATLVLFL